MEQYLQRELKAAISALRPVLKDDKKYQKMEPIEEIPAAINLMGSLYIRYLKVVNVFIEVHEYLLNPMERKYLKIMIERILGRVLELKHEMVEVEKSDFQYLDNIIAHNYLTNRTSQLKIRSCFRDGREDLLDELYARFDDVMYRKEHPEEFIEEAEEEQSTLFDIPSTTSAGSKSKIQVATSKKTVTPAQSEVSVNRSDIEKKRPKFIEQPVRVYEFLDQIILIQSHERARRARLVIRKIHENLRLRQDIALMIHKPIPEGLKLSSIEAIQYYYMKYKWKKWRKYVDTYNRLVYGTLTPAFRDKSDIIDVQNLWKVRRIDQKQLGEKMKNQAVLIKESMQGNKRYEIIEDLIDELRAFVRDWYEYTKEFGYPEVPAEWPSDEPIEPPTRYVGIPEGLSKTYYEERFPEMDFIKAGGSLEPPLTLAGSEIISAGCWIPVELFAHAHFILRTAGIKRIDPERAALEREQELEKQERLREEAIAKMEELMRRGHVPGQSVYFPIVNAQIGEFQQDWEAGKVIPWPVQEANVEEKLKRQAVYEIRKEVRKEVDDEMREDLEVLKAAVEKDYSKDRKPVPEVPKKKQKKKPKKKKKKKADPLAKRSPESLYEQLVFDGLVIKCEPVDVDSLVGEFNLHAQVARMRLESPHPYMGDVYQVAKEYVALPLGSDIIKEHTHAIKSVLFIGPKRYTLPLVHGLAYSVGALLLYLPVLNFKTRFKKKMLINVIMKVARNYQPSVLFINDIEKPFYKKIPKEERAMKPGTLRTIIPKIIKSIKAADRVIVLGATDQPWAAKAKLASIFQKILLCSGNDYYAMTTLVEKTLMSNQGVDREFDTSIPSWMFLGRPLDDVEERLKSIFTTERRIKLKYEPLQTEETGCTEEETKKNKQLEDWYANRYKLNVKREEMLEDLREKRRREEKLKEKAKKQAQRVK